MKRFHFGTLLILALMCSIGLFWEQLGAQQSGQSQSPFRFRGADAFGIESAAQNDTRHEHQRAELLELDQKTRKIAAELRSTPDEKKEAELRKLVEDFFDKRHAAQVAEMKLLAEKLAKMQELLKKREQKKDEIVLRRIKQLLGESDDLDWELTTPRANQDIGLAR